MKFNKFNRLSRGIRTAIISGLVAMSLSLAPVGIATAADYSEGTYGTGRYSAGCSSDSRGTNCNEQTGSSEGGDLTNTGSNNTLSIVFGVICLLASGALIVKVRNRSNKSK